TPYRALDVTATGDARDTYSFRGKNAYNVPEVSPVKLYQNLFGSRFQDPNSDRFTPDPQIMVEKSVLSGVIEQTSSLNRSLGYEDRQRLDQFFSGLRDVENQLATYLEKPEPRPACQKPGVIQEEFPSGVDSKLVAQRHELMTQILI